MEYPQSLRVTQPCGVEVAGQEVQNSPVWSNKVVSCLLLSEKYLFIRWGELFFDIERIMVSAFSLRKSQRPWIQDHLPEVIAEDTKPFADCALPALCDLHKDPGLHAGILVDHAEPERYTELYGLLGEYRERDANKVVCNGALILPGSAQQSSGSSQNVTQLTNGHELTLRCSIFQVS